MTSTSVSPRADSRRHGWLLAAVILLAIVPLVVGAAALGHRGWAPTGEFAQADLRMADFWSHPPELGATGRLRDGADVSSHPGPAAWWMMEPVDAVFGRSATGLSTAVAVMAMVWLALAVWMSWRRGGVVLAVLVASVLVIAARAFGASSFLEPWNPWFGIFPFAVLLLSVWESALGTWWAPFVAVATGSFCVQAHVGYLPLVGALLLVPAVAICVHLARDPDRRARWWWSLGGSVALAGVLWALPLHQQLTNDPGNMTVLLRAYRHQTDAALGLRGGARLLGEYLSVAGPWIAHHGPEPTGRGASWGTVVLVVAWVAAIVVSVVGWRREGSRWWPVVTLHGVLLGTTVVAWLTVARIKGEPFHYLVAWLPILTCLVIAAIAWTATRAFAGRRAVQVMTVAAAILLFVAVSVTSVQFSQVDAPGGWLSDSTEALGRQVGQRLDPSGPTLVRWTDPVAFGGIGFGLLADLEHRGFQVGADATYRTEVVPHRVMSPSQAARVLYVVTGEKAIERWRARDVDRVARTDPLDPKQRAAAERIHAEILDRLRSEGHAEAADHFDDNMWAALNDRTVSPATRALMRRYAEMGLPTAVFLLPPGATPPA
jgi:hypothetical protein